ncbi:hypothetical protein AURDEDRAFT_160889 [Auricularia subglabra TFB-10046 SS5]|nr:hypothetical protein AURDEDRAFT_160889 [Auricularia subglabra TFB-10046 SS5]
MVDKIHEASHPHVSNIISGFSGVVRHSQMLHNGPRHPGVGYITLLHTLSNETSQFHVVSGHHTDVLYCPEHDVHFPALCIGETESFSVTTRTPQRRIEDALRKTARGTRRMIEITTTVFGLCHALKMPVGVAAMRGVSGSEKKRASIAEAMVSCARFGHHCMQRFRKEGIAGMRTQTVRRTLGC